MLVVALLSLFMEVSTKKVVYDYREVTMMPRRLSWIQCYLNKAENATFFIQIDSFDGDGKKILRTDLQVSKKTAIVRSVWNNDEEMTRETYNEYVPMVPRGASPLPRVNVVFIQNSTHFGFGCRELFAAEAEIPFRLEEVKSMHIEAWGKEMEYCDAALNCERRRQK